MSPEMIRRKAEMYRIEFEAQSRALQTARQQVMEHERSVVMLQGAISACNSILQELEEPSQEEAARDA